MKTTLLFLAVVFLAWLPGCSPWVAGPVWTEGATVGHPVDKVTWTNQWRPSRVFTTVSDGSTSAGDVQWISWESEAMAEKTGVFAERE